MFAYGFSEWSTHYFGKLLVVFMKQAKRIFPVQFVGSSHNFRYWPFDTTFVFYIVGLSVKKYFRIFLICRGVIISKNEFCKNLFQFVIFKRSISYFICFVNRRSFNCRFLTRSIIKFLLLLLSN